MINAAKTRQKWEIGSRVKVGFLTLTVIGMAETKGDYMPDEYHLMSDKGVAYVFVPHNGLTRV